MIVVPLPWDRHSTEGEEAVSQLEVAQGHSEGCKFTPSFSVHGAGWPPPWATGIQERLPVGATVRDAASGVLLSGATCY
jgi:hypothetical protein